MNAYTDLKQSKKLMELGIDANTADMCHRYRWSNNSFILLPCAEKAREPITGDIPAWSLSALLSVLPRIEHLRPSIDLNPKLDSNEVAIYYHSEDSPYIVRDNLIDAAFEMICWLKENNEL